MGVEDKSDVIDASVVEKRADYDSESQESPVPENGTLKRQLKNRHIAMIRCVQRNPHRAHIGLTETVSAVSVVCLSPLLRATSCE